MVSTPHRWRRVGKSVLALHYPYVVAFEPTFIEVHHVETGHLVQIITGNNIRCLFADTLPSRVNAPPLPIVGCTPVKLEGHTAVPRPTPDTPILPTLQPTFMPRLPAGATTPTRLLHSALALARLPKWADTPFPIRISRLRRDLR
ncbi:hypothetical protein L198_07351 [Cryptococcus wingfieldii CBS 7118]|uniref:CNH domain-containing protein n=1 Tax=Cryptococcus wingfieldii CBS 7118 TaxID=1295528 RepID=A0A1E3ICJ5_9TREE|nr:hypothetical protein L198_07351 [Cryptococcus wingfieldii CBS 7118]ODN86332.1 hypothetical protein L198_07351 [Cryptococcus wingfieldii CBS 7118]